MKLWTPTRRKLLTGGASLIAAPYVARAASISLLGAGNAGSAPWVPTSLGAALKLWLKADAGVTQSGGNVSQWNDQSSSGFSFTQALTNKPTFSSTGFNTSFPGITFLQSANQFLRTSAFSFSSATMSIFIVNSHTSASPDTSGLLSLEASGVGNDTTIPSFVMGSDSTHTKEYAFSGGFLGTEIPVADNTAVSFGLILDGANAQLYKNGVASGASSAFTASVGGGAGGALAIGSRVTAAIPFDGTIAEIIMTNTALASGDITGMQTYFSRWGL